MSKFAQLLRLLWGVAHSVCWMFHYSKIMKSPYLGDNFTSPPYEMTVSSNPSWCRIFNVSWTMWQFTYIHNWSLQSYSQEVVSHETYVVCVNFIHKRRDLQFKVDSERQIFWETFHGNSICSQSFCQKSAERKSPKKYFSYFV